MVLLLAFVQQSRGKSENNKIATNFASIVVPTLFTEFPHMGCNAQGRSNQILQQSYSEFRYFASGRKNCLFAEFKLSLIRRHCMLTRYTYDLIKGTQDTLVIDLPIDLGSRNLPLEFFICKKKDLKKKLDDLGTGASMIHNSNAKNYRPANPAYKNTFVIMSEHDEISNQLIDNNVGQLLLKYASGMLQELHITDQKTYNSMNLMMKAVLRLPKAGENN